MSKVNKWLLRGIHDPNATLHYIFYGKHKTDISIVRQLAETLHIGSKNEVKKFYQNIDSAKDFRSNILGRLAGDYFGEVQEESADSLYVITRLLKPKVVVETGVSAGISSAFILKALTDNGIGALNSIDLPWEEFYTSSPEETRTARALSAERVGFAVPENLLDRWTLRIGRSREILPGLLKELGQIQMFFHDSEHTYQNMMFEFNTAWDYLQSGGLLLSHNIYGNDSFQDFCRKVKRKNKEIYFASMGVIMK